VKHRPASTSSAWPSLAIIAGGLLMAVLWFRYITLHGPTTFDEEGYWLGRGTEFWGSMMSAPSSLLIALGLSGHYSLLTGHAGRRARIGFVLIMIGLVVPALVELATLAIWPPLLAPLTAIGLLLLLMVRRTRACLPRAARATLFLGLALDRLAPDSGDSRGHVRSNRSLSAVRDRGPRALRRGLGRVRRKPPQSRTIVW